MYNLTSRTYFLHGRLEVDIKFYLWSRQSNLGNLLELCNNWNTTSSVVRIIARLFGLMVTNPKYDPPISIYTDIIPEMIERLRLPWSREFSSGIQQWTLRSIHTTYNHCVLHYLEQASMKQDWIEIADVNSQGILILRFWNWIILRIWLLFRGGLRNWRIN